MLGTEAIGLPDRMNAPDPSHTTRRVRVVRSPDITSDDGYLVERSPTGSTTVLSSAERATALGQHRLEVDGERRRNDAIRLALGV